MLRPLPLPSSCGLGVPVQPPRLGFSFQPNVSQASSPPVLNWQNPVWGHLERSSGDNLVNELFNMGVLTHSSGPTVPSKMFTQPLSIFGNTPVVNQANTVAHDRNIAEKLLSGKARTSALDWVSPMHAKSTDTGAARARGLTPMHFDSGAELISLQELTSAVNHLMSMGGKKTTSDCLAGMAYVQPQKAGAQVDGRRRVRKDSGDGRDNRGGKHVSFSERGVSHASGSHPKSGKSAEGLSRNSRSYESRSSSRLYSSSSGASIRSQTDQRPTRRNPHQSQGSKARATQPDIARDSNKSKASRDESVPERVYRPRRESRMSQGDPKQVPTRQVAAAPVVSVKSAEVLAPGPAGDTHALPSRSEAVAVDSSGGGVVIMQKQQAGHRGRWDMRMTYSREFVLRCAYSPYTCLPPADLPYISMQLRQLLRPFPGKFSPRDYQKLCLSPSSPNL